MSAQYPNGPIMSVSNGTRSPTWMARPVASWYHGLLLGPEHSIRPSIQSPSWAMLTWWRMDHSWFSLTPGTSAASISASPSSATSIE